MEQIKLHFEQFSEDNMLERAQTFRSHMIQRRTVRAFDDRPIPPAVLNDALRVATSAPSGANRQPWRFVVIEDLAIKRRIQVAAEKEEQEFYATRAPDEWLEALEPLGTDANKPFLSEAPVLIAIFLERFGIDRDGNRIKNYYMTESVGIATGFLIAALHHAGLATLTHTPSPMRFLNEILNRPSRERPFLLLVVGYPKKEATVPAIERLPFNTVVTKI